jgi:hypothetical protein
MQGTILIKNSTRERLRQLGIKGQTYDSVINQLIDLKGKNSNWGLLDDRLQGLQSSKSRNP